MSNDIPEPKGAFQMQLDDSLRTLFVEMAERRMDHVTIFPGAPLAIHVTMVKVDDSEEFTRMVQKFLQGGK